MRNRYPWVINSRIYTLTHRFSKYSENQFQHISVVLKSKNWPEHHQFFAGSFMRTIRFWEEPEQPILWFWFLYKGKKNRRFSVCRILNEPEVLWEFWRIAPHYTARDHNKYFTFRCILYVYGVHGPFLPPISRVVAASPHWKRACSLWHRRRE
jgi:hypothetical protein